MNQNGQNGLNGQNDGNGFRKHKGTEWINYPEGPNR